MFALTPGKPIAIAEGVWRLLALNPGMMSGPGTNTYLLADGESLWVMDPGPSDPRHVDNIIAAAEHIGLPISTVLCTHTHRDHSPATALLRERLTVTVLGPEVVNDSLQDEHWHPDQVLVDGQQLSLADKSLRVIATPGHVGNHLCFLLEQPGLLFSGDHLINGSTVVIAPPSGSMNAYLDSLRKLQPFAIDRIAPGHGDLILNPAEAIASTIAHRLRREEKVAAALAENGPATAAYLVKKVYADVPDFLHPIAEFSLLAHLIKLTEDGRAQALADQQFVLSAPPQ